MRLVRADRGVELVATYLSLSEMKLNVHGPFGGAAASGDPPPTRPPEPGLRQSKLRFLDGLSGRIYLPVKVVLDLPVIGNRSLGQELRVSIQEGSLDYPALEDSLKRLEGDRPPRCWTSTPARTGIAPDDLGAPAHENRSIS